MAGEGKGFPSMQWNVVLRDDNNPELKLSKAQFMELARMKFAEKAMGYGMIVLVDEPTRHQDETLPDGEVASWWYTTATGYVPDNGHATH